MVLFDRDGTLNQDTQGHTFKISEFAWTVGGKESILLCKELSLKVAVVTNQSGIAKGKYTGIQVKNFHDYMNLQLPEQSKIDAFFICPHHPNGIMKDYSIECECRKPKKGLIVEALKYFSLQPSEAILFGNSHSDITAGLSAGVESFLYESGSLLELVDKHLARDF